MKHQTTVEHAPDGYLGKCETCGDRQQEFTGYGPSLDWCDKHERAPYANAHRGSGSLRALAGLYRDRATNIVYDSEERQQWRLLAEEIEAEMEARNVRVLPGQLALLDDDPQE